MAYSIIPASKNTIPGKIIANHWVAYQGLVFFQNFVTFHFSVSEQETWADAANRIIQKSQTERTKSCQLRADAEALINRVARDMWESWTNTNNALTRRSSEMLEAKSQLQQHIHRVFFFLTLPQLFWYKFCLAITGPARNFWRWEESWADA